MIENLVLQFGSFTMIAAAVIAGVLVLLGVWDKASRNRKKAITTEEDRLIQILQKTVAELSAKIASLENDRDTYNAETEKAMARQSEKIDKLEKRVIELNTENSLLLKILQGRDEQTQEFIAKVVKAVDTTSRNNELLEKTTSKLDAIVSMISNPKLK